MIMTVFGNSISAGIIKLRGDHNGLMTDVL